MTIWIALLRGINVGGKNKIKMDALRRALDEIGLKRVQTYIQSGNVLFCSDDVEEHLRQRMEQQIQSSFGLSISVVLRTLEELRTTISKCPFSEEEILQAETTCEGECLYVSFLQTPATEEHKEQMNAMKKEGDQFQLVGRDVYLLFTRSIRNSKLAAGLGKVKIPATVRNWNTIQKLVALGSAMEIAPVE